MDSNGQEQEYVNRTYRLAPDVAEGIKELAQEHQLYDSSLVSYMLRYALKAVTTGKLPIRRRPVAYVIDDREL